MPAADSATPAHRAGGIRSWPSAAVIKATNTGVQPMISELFAAVVRDSATMNNN